MNPSDPDFLRGIENMTIARIKEKYAPFLSSCRWKNFPKRQMIDFIKSEFQNDEQIPDNDESPSDSPEYHSAPNSVSRENIERETHGFAGVAVCGGSRACPPLAGTAGAGETLANFAVASDTQTFTFIDLCAGCGGLSSGLVKAGLRPLLLNDNDKDCCETLKLNHIGAKIICAPFEELDYTEFIGRVDVFVAGCPCQSYSQAGNRRGLDDPRGLLIMRFIEIVHIVKPKIFMIENVPGLVSHNRGETLKSIIKAITDRREYTVVYQVLDASDYGVAQKRKRLFIMGARDGGICVFPKPLRTPKKLLGDVLRNVPPSDGSTYSELKKSLFRRIRPGGCWKDLPLEDQMDYLGNSFNSGGGKTGILRRLSMDEPCLTILCSPSQKQTERCHPLEERPLTIRESARIQSFPDEYCFHGSKTSVYKQIGNAVPVELAYHIGLSIAKQLLSDREHGEYFAKIKPEIKSCLSNLTPSQDGDDILEDLLLDDLIKANAHSFQTAKLIKQIQMKIGTIWQICIGNWESFQDLKVGHSTGLDVSSSTRKMTLELKNRYNTDNASARKTNYEKLARRKKERSDYECIYGVINEKPPSDGEAKEIDVDLQGERFRIIYMSGKILLQYIFGDKYEEIINFVKALINMELSERLPIHSPLGHNLSDESDNEPEE